MNKRTVIRRVDLALLAILVISIGIATILFWILALREMEDDESATLPTITHTPLPTASFTMTITSTRTQIASPSVTASFTLTPLPTPEVNPLIAVELYAGQTVVLSGQAEPDQTIILFSQGISLAQSAADSDGHWELLLENGLEAGNYILEVVAIDDEGVQSIPAPVSLLIQPRPTETQTSTPSPTSTIIPSLTSSPSATFTRTVTSTPTITPSQTSTTTETPTPTTTWTSIPSATTTIAPSETATPSPTNTRVPPTEAVMISPTVTVTPSLTSTATLMPPTETASPTITLSATVTPSLTSTTTATTIPSATNTPTATVSPTSTATTVPATETPTNVPSATNTLTQTSSPTSAETTAAPTETATSVPSATNTLTQTPSPTSTETTAAPTETPTNVPSATNTLTQTPSPTEISQTVTILTPENDSTIAAGIIHVTGLTASNTNIQLVNDDGDILATTRSAANGNWTVTLIIETAQTLTVTAQLAENETIQSESITFTVVPIVHPPTGIASPKPENQRGATYTALLALLLTAFGFILIYAGRLFYGWSLRKQR